MFYLLLGSVLLILISAGPSMYSTRQQQCKSQHSQVQVLMVALYVIHSTVYCRPQSSKLTAWWFFFHIRTVHLDIIKVLFIHRRMH